MNRETFPSFDPPLQVVRDAPLVTIVFRSGRIALQRLLPASLDPHADGRVIFNMWSHEGASCTTGFGAPAPMSVAYFAVEVNGDQGISTDGRARFPGRCWTHHWCSLPAARRYAWEFSGLQLLDGCTSTAWNGSILDAVFLIDGVWQIRASLHVRLDEHTTASGRSIYYSERHPANHPAEVAQFDIPWVADRFNVTNYQVEINEAGNSPWRVLFDDTQPVVESVSYREITLVPYVTSRVIA